MAVGAVTLLIAGLRDFDISAFEQTPLTFESGGHTLSGTLIIPRDAPQPPAAVIVHGDGPQDRFSADGYLSLFNVLLDAGIAVFSWDKPGVGQSDGNWLGQSMQDRTNEAIAALQAIQSHPSVPAEKVGFLGFSQAGWVIPKATNTITPAFSVLIGPAVNWQQQGAYFMRKRLEAEGATEAQITAEIAASAQRDAVMLAPDYTPTPDDLRGIAPARFAFVARNHTADAARDIAGMTGPVLAVWGADDLNVDAVTDAAIYESLLPDPATQTVRIIPNATHGLLRARLFNYQLIEQWPSYAKAIFLFDGRRAFAPGIVDQITSWIHLQAE